MRIDFHVHLAIREQLLPTAAGFCDAFWDGGRGDWSELVSHSERFDAYLESEGVDYVVGLPEVSPGVTGVTTNEFVLERYAESKKVILFSTLNARDEDPAAQVHRLAGQGFRGIKLYPTYQAFYPNDEKLYPMYEACVEHRWPVMVHTGSSIFPGSKMKYGEPMLLDDVAVDFPGLNILIVHGGRGPWYGQAEFLAGFHPNVYLEVSGLPPQKLLTYFPNMDKIGNKVVFGSDWPGNPGIRANMEAVAKLPLDEKTIGDILGNTAARLLGLDSAPHPL